jgi:hypothetical protein
MIQVISLLAILAIGTIIAFDAHWTANLALQLLVLIVTDLATLANTAVVAFLAILRAGEAFFTGGIEIVHLHAREAGG